MNPGPHGHDAADTLWSITWIYMSFLWIFPNQLRTHNHCIVWGEFLFMSISWRDLKMRHYLYSCLSGGWKLVSQSRNSINIFPTPVTTRICQSARSGNWNVKSDLCLFTFVTAGVTLGLSQHIHNKNKIRARPSDIILSILPVTWSERELKIKRDLTRLRAGRIKWGCSDSK